MEAKEFLENEGYDIKSDFDTEAVLNIMRSWSEQQNKKLRLYAKHHWECWVKNTSEGHPKKCICELDEILNR